MLNIFGKVVQVKVRLADGSLVVDFWENPITSFDLDWMLSFCRQKYGQPVEVEIG